MAQDLVSTLDGVLDVLVAAAIPHALCGGLAVNLYGHVRATKDIDLLVERGDLDRIRAALRPLGFTLDAGPIPFAVGTPRETASRR